MESRPVRDNDPGDLEAGAHWQGLMDRANMTSEQASEDRFAVFASPKWGFRALAITLLNYQRVHKLNTVRQIISRFAPASENDTEAYIRAVSLEMGVNPDAPIDLTNAALLTTLVKAISRHEAGGWFFTEQDLAAGVAKAEA